MDRIRRIRGGLEPKQSPPHPAPLPCVVCRNPGPSASVSLPFQICTHLSAGRNVQTSLTAKSQFEKNGCLFELLRSIGRDQLAQQSGANLVG